MKRCAMAVALLAVLTACGSGGGGGTAQDPGSVIVQGNIYNPPAGKPAASPMMAGATFDRLASVSSGSLITISTVVINQTAQDQVNIQYEIGIEFEEALTKEWWQCWQCYNSGPGATICNGVWQIYGGTLVAPIPAPALPVCSAAYVPQPTSGTCIDPTDPGIDCASGPTYKMDYNAPGSGYVTMGGTIPLLKSGATFSSASGWGSSALIPKADRKAYWIVRDAAQKELANKAYLFDVVP